MGRLSVMTGLKSGTEIPLINQEMIIGRQAGCEIVLPDHTVSRHHARILTKDDGYYLEDMGSRNGTYLNGRRITRPTRLKSEDQIQLYDITLTYLDDDAYPESERSIRSLITPHPWSSGELDEEPQRLNQTETVAEMDVAYDEEEQSHDNAEIRLRLILEITRCLESPYEREQMLSRLLERLAKIFPQMDRGYILLANEAGNQLKPVAIRQSVQDRIEEMTIRPVTRSIARQVLQEGKAILSVDRISPENQPSVLDHEFRSIICAPLIGATRKPLGIIYIDSDEVNQRFTPEDLNILTCVSILTGQALEQESQHSARFRAVVDTAADGIVTFNDSGIIESVNPALEELFGWKSNELVQKDVSILIPSIVDTLFSRNADQDTIELIKSQDQEIWGQKRDGNQFPIHLSIGQFDLNDRKFFTGILHDISERKNAELRLKQSQQELKDFVESAIIGLRWITPDGRIVWANQAELDLLGYQKEEYVDHHFSEFHVDSWVSDDIMKRFLAGEELRNYPARLQGKSGDIRDVLISSTIYRRDGEIVQHRCFTRDITEKKKAEEALHALNENLEMKVRDRTRSVKLLQDVATIANEAETVSQAFQSTLNQICQYMKWPVGHAYFVDPENPDLFVDSRIWSHEDTANLRALKDISVDSKFRPGEGMVGTVVSTKKPVWFENPEENSIFTRARELTDSSLDFGLAFPVTLGDQVVAVLEFFSSESSEPDKDLLDVMSNIGTQLSRVVERRRLQEELIDAVWEQQRYFGQELHDTLGQELTGIGMMIASLANKVKEENLQISESVLEIGEMIQQAKTGVRRLAKGLFPVEVDAEGLRAALADLTRSTEERCNIECEFVYNKSSTLTDNNVATHLFRIAQEAVNNAVKHSQASKITVELLLSEAGVSLSISDNGQGVETDRIDQYAGMGLSIMRYRANLIGAIFEIDSHSSSGTRVTCYLPLPQALESQTHAYH
ncbi:MAG: PAS domain S-box protein [Planctomycetaceae bacterium]|nr:PAS domain S-box protein [Planctomycetaceae bacterium]